MTQLRYMSGKELITRRFDRDAKLAWIRQQVASGELVIRQATPAERERFGIRAPAAAPPRARRRSPQRSVASGRSKAAHAAL
jgi:hypothetical protein